MIYTCKPSRLALYINTARKSAEQVKAETGCTALINGGLFNMSTFQPVCHLKADGRVLAKDPYGYWGFAWNDTNDITMTSNYSEYNNYICCVCMVREGKTEKLIYPADMGGARPRTAFGLFDDGRVWLYASTSDKLTPEQLQQVALRAGVKHAVMMDGGGSTQGISPAGTVSSSRKVHNFICVWAEEDKLEGVTDSMTKKVFIGVGHGGSDPGAMANGFKEKDLNLSIALACAAELERHDVTVLMSRTKDENDTLSEEIKECNAFAPDLAVDIHNNAGGGDGAEAYHHHGGGVGKTLAETILKEVTAIGQNSRGAKFRKNDDGRDYYGFIRETKAPAVIVECAFVDNTKDMTVLDTAQEQAAMGEAIAKGILATLGIAYKPKSSKLYRVQVGAFKNKANAEDYMQKLKAAGFEAFIVEA